MKRLFLLGVAFALVAAAIFGPGGAPGTVHADPFNNLIEYNVTYSTTAPASTPNLSVQVNIDCPAGVCPAASNAPFFDIAVTHYSAAIDSCTAADGPPCAGDVPINALVGTTNFQLNTNIVAANLPDNVNPVTGVPANCGAAGTTTLASVADITNGARSAGDLVSGKDGADADSLPDTQADVRGLAPLSPPNGEYDGSDALPDYIQLLFSTALPLMVGRGFAVAVIVPGAAQTDVNFVTLDLTSFGLGFAAITTLGDVRPATIADINAGQSTVTCAPFTSTVNTLGVSADDPDTATVEAPTPTRRLVGAAATPLYYSIDISGAEDVDGDGIPAALDLCATVAGSPDADGDRLGDTCGDPNPATRDNNGSGGPAAYPTSQDGCTRPAIGTEGPITCTTPWDPDQDIDGDQHANWTDNCPTIANAWQLDRNADGVGDACQTGVPTARGSVPMRPEHDHDDFCATSTTIGGAVAPGTTCYAATAHAAGVTTAAPTAGVAQDSDDDGFPDFLTIPGQTFTDRNSDSDWDGCDDFAETSGGIAAGACGASFGTASGALPSTQCGVGIATCLKAKSVNTNGLQNNCAAAPPNCFDGQKDDPNGIADWRDLSAAAAVPPYDTTSNPNGGGSPDSDLDGCTNRREALAVANQGGTRDATNKWDFYDVDTPVGGNLLRNKAIAVADTLAIVSYIGVNTGAPLTPNGNGKTYGGDENKDGIPNFEIFDRSAAGTLSGPPNGAINIGDALANLSQTGANCSTP